MVLLFDEVESMPVNIHGDTAQVIRGNSSGYAEYLADYAAADDKAAFNSGAMFRKCPACGKTHLSPVIICSLCKFDARKK